LFAGHYQSWNNDGVEVQTTVDRAGQDWQGHVGVVTRFIDRIKIATPTRTQMLTCGPEIMMKHVVAAARRPGIPDKNLWLSLERHMNCAFGHCGHCQFGSHFICKDGPVLRYDKVHDFLQIDSL
jgi:NAD(P)H-flavin reductase